MMAYRLFLTLWVYQIYHVVGVLKSGELRIKKTDSRKSLSFCQACVLNELGASRMKLINDDEEVATYKITGSDFVFANLKLDCSGVNECNIDKIIPLSWPSMMPNEIALSARSPQLYVSASESSSSVLCMDCLQENAAARFISKFWVNKLKVVRIVYMIYGALLNTQHLKCTDYCPGLTILEEMDNSKQLVQIFRSEEHLPLSRIRHHVIQCNASSHK